MKNYKPINIICFYTLPPNSPFSQTLRNPGTQILKFSNSQTFALRLFFCFAIFLFGPSTANPQIRSTWSLNVLSQQTGLTRCLSTESRDVSQSQDAHFIEIKKEQEKTIQDWIKNNGNRVGQRSIITIPVVVHVIWNSPEENIPDEQIFSQIETLNQDFRALNVEIENIPAEFQPLIADAEIEFCLAKTDPSGNETMGITRTFTNNPVGIGGTPAIHFGSQGGKDAWDPELYLNIWVAKFAGNIGGTGSFPGQGPPEEDGVEVNYLQFGSVNTQPPYHLGRTLTHEIGHYLNLEHPWGPSISDCCGDDFVADTPEACETYIGQCPDHPVVSCSQPDLFMDFMFYTDDACLGMFTEGQKMRMLATLNTLRPGLMQSMACEPVSTDDLVAGMDVKVFPNPAEDKLYIEIEGQQGFGDAIKILDLWGREMLEEKNFNDVEINVSAFPAGVYFLLLKNKTGIHIEKVVIN